LEYLEGVKIKYSILIVAAVYCIELLYWKKLASS